MAHLKNRIKNDQLFYYKNLLNSISSNGFIRHFSSLLEDSDLKKNRGVKPGAQVTLYIIYSFVFLKKPKKKIE